MQQHSRAMAPTLAGLCAVALLGALWITADVDPLRPDTASYLFFDPSRPIGYPVFLWLAGKLGSVTYAVPLQMVALTIALGVLGWAFYRWTGRPVLALLFQLGLMLSPEVWKFSAMLLTEATSTAAVALWCAQLFRTVRSTTLRGVGLLTAISALAVLLKPSLLPLFLGTAIPILGFASWRDRGWALGIIAGGLVATLATTPLANLLIHGSSDGGSPVARGVLQHSLFCPLPNAPTDPDSAFVDRYARIATDYVNSAPAAVQPGIKRLYTGRLRFGLIIPSLGRRLGVTESWQTDELIWRIARERIAANPGCYVRSVLGSYFTMATYDSNSRAEAKRLERFLAASPPPTLPVAPLLERDQQIATWAARDVGASEPSLPGRKDIEPPTGRPLPLIWLARIAYGGAGLIGLLAIFALLALRRMSQPLKDLTIALAALGVVFHGVFGLTAIVELALARYTVPLWPVVCSLLGLTGAFAIERALQLAGRSRVRQPDGAAHASATG